MFGGVDKWPRQYATEIMAEPDKEKRREMFDRVPEQLQDMVWDHCQTAMRTRNAKVQRN